jgi:hypothetical protein
MGNPAGDMPIIYRIPKPSARIAARRHIPSRTGRV